MKGVFFGFFFLCSCSFASAEPSWIKIYLHQSIKAEKFSCKSALMGETFYLTTESEEFTEPSMVKFHNRPNVWPFKYIYKFIEFTRTDGIKFFSDQSKNIWIDEMTLSEPLLTWILSYAAGSDLCKVPMKVERIFASNVTVKFDREGIEGGVLFSRAKPVHLSVELADKGHFEVDLTFAETLMDNW